jgi:choline-glycine betaine transporter
MSTMASRGALEPPRLVTGILGALMGAIASALLLVGGLTGLQQGAVLASVPFTFVIVLVAWCLFKALRTDPAVAQEPPRVAPRPYAVGPGTYALDVDEGEPSP